MSDKNYFKNKRLYDGKRNRRKRVLQPYNYLIVCEGTKTEPNYFKSIKNIIESKYRTEISITIKGTGRNTLSLVEYTEKVINRASADYTEIWIVMDKDDFPSTNFDNSIMQAKSKGYKIAWSNEAIELWFLLHFEYMNSAVIRSQYNDKLTNYFIQNGLGKYKKNSTNIFDILEKYGDRNFAISNAKKLQELHNNNDVKSFSKMNPSTTLYLLIEELYKYI